jgi:photosystem II stability/assembly factor-like uncharacterized protein
MKKFYLFFSALLISSATFSQWTLLNSGVTNTLRSPYFINGYTGITVGEPLLGLGDAIILKTTDGGLTWVTKISGTTNALRAVHFIDSVTGFACGFAGTLLKTTDVGDTWTSVSTGSIQNFRSLDFPSHDTGYIAGGAGTVMKTEDAGDTWIELNTGITQDLVNIRFADNNVGYAVASTGFNLGAIIKTIDGGVTWNTAHTDPEGLLAIAVIDENTVLAGGGNNTVDAGGFEFITRTTNGGDDWEEVFSGGPEQALRAAEFISPTMGWFVGDSGTLLMTQDAGDTWEQEDVSVNGYLGIQFPTFDTGYVVGALGTIIKYIAIGTDITPVTAATEVSINPNPFSTFTTLTYHGNESLVNASLLITDMAGRRVRVTAIAGDRPIVITREKLTSGVYYYKLLNENNDAVVSGKFVVE